MVLRTHLDDILVATISGIIRSCLWVPQDPVRRYHHDVVIHELHCPKLSEKGGV